MSAPTGPAVVTLTANPSLDRTLVLPGALSRGEVARLAGAATEPGGKGVNVARALAAAGTDVLSVLPAADDDPIVAALHRRGVGTVLLTLGADGALLSSAEGLWSATPPRVAVRSTVGAGDCSLAGYLLADLAGAPPADRLRSAVAYGAASAALPGSAVPTPAQVDGAAVRVTAGLPGSRTFESSFSSPVDVYRGTTTVAQAGGVG